MKRPFALVAMIAGLLSGCASIGTPTVAHVDSVDLPRFMGDWYVIAHIPSRPEREAYNAVETYRLLDDGRIQTTFRYRKGSFDAPEKVMTPVGRVVPGFDNAVWGMQFVWPIQAEYVIGALDAGYTQTLVVRSKRDYAWLMARTPRIPEADYTRHVETLRSMGYDVSQLRRVPQRWPESGSD
jgi:apolipoprotein D and lipocalin family protein